MKTKITLIMLIFCGLCSYSQEKPKNKMLDISAGYFLGYNEISKKEFKSILSTNDKAFKEYKSGKTLWAVGLTLSGASAIYLGWGIGSGTIETEGYIGGGIGLVGGFLVMVVGKSRINKSIQTYNRSLEEITFNFGATSNGIGLTVSF